jgi:hypothetical protein
MYSCDFSSHAKIFLQASSLSDFFSWEDMGPIMINTNIIAINNKNNKHIILTHMAKCSTISFIHSTRIDPRFRPPHKCIIDVVQAAVQTAVAIWPIGQYLHQKSTHGIWLFFSTSIFY